jgi:hypothetical protein
MSPNFSTSLLSQNLDSVAPPTALPTGTEYSGVVSKHEFRKLKQKDGQEAAILTYSGKFLDWSPEIPEDERKDAHGKHIDITQKSWRMDFFYESEAGAFNLAKFLKSVGLKGGSLEEAIPKAIGANVIVKGEQKLVEKDNSLIFNVKAISGI